jgi:hypothetical protein
MLSLRLYQTRQANLIPFEFSLNKLSVSTSNCSSYRSHLAAITSAELLGIPTAQFFQAILETKVVGNSLYGGRLA